MVVQNQVKRTLTARLPEVCTVVASGAGSSRSAIAEELCRRFGFVDRRGNHQRASCLKALRGLEMAGHFRLPTSRSRNWRGRSPRRLAAAVPEPVGVPASAGLLCNLELIAVRTDARLRLWNELMVREHPLGDGPLVGRQLRYLLRSDHGYLGAVGFGSCALYLHDRDRWIGWDGSLREAHLDKIVCMSRFLIRPSVKCSNLASKALAMACRALPVDFEKRYGYRPWLLESFVDPQQHQGTCYRAANWLRVGSSCGRGRQDRKMQTSKSRKDIYLYVLDKRFRQYLGVRKPVRYPPVKVVEATDEDSWAANEFGGAPMGDKRLEKRLISIAQSKAKSPGQSFLETVHADRAAVAGYYRFIDAPAESRIAMNSILRPHRDRTLRRMNSLHEALCIHDTTDVNFATLDACEGLGIIGKNQTKTKTRGLRLHSSFVVDADDGLPLGILHANCYAPPPKRRGKKKDPRYIPVDKKQSFRWITSLRQCTKLTAELDGTRVIHVMDREGDFFELFAAWRDDGRDELVIRAKNDRRTNSDTSLFRSVLATETKASLTVDIPRKSARRKKGRNKAQPRRQKRRATLQVRYCPVAILPPKHGLSSKKSPVDAFIVHVKEEVPPADGSKAVEWFLLTTLSVDSPEDAERVFRHYVKRWRIEEWHRALKTCCGAEEPAHRNAERLKRLLAINMVLAWRVMLMMLLGREIPQLPATVLFADDQIEVLKLLAKKWRCPKPTYLQDYVILMARLGGYLNRKCDGPPGAEILWRSLITLTHMCIGFALSQLE